MGGLGVTKSRHTFWGYSLELHQVTQGKKNTEKLKIRKIFSIGQNSGPFQKVQNLRQFSLLLLGLILLLGLKPIEKIIVT